MVTHCLTCDYDRFNRTPIMKLINLTDGISSRLCVTRLGARTAFVGLLAAALGLNAWAQEEVAPASPVSPPPSAPVASGSPHDLQQAPVGGTRVVSPLEAAPSASSERPPFQWGLVSLRPDLNYRLLYGDGIQSAPGQQLKTAINAVSLGLLFGIGDHWTLDYTPTKTFYSNKAFRDTFDNAVLLNGGTTFEEWVFGLTGSFGTSSPSLVETGTQTKQKTWSGTASVGYHLNSRLFLDTSVSQNNQTTDAFNSFREWSTSDWLHYQFTPQFDTAIGFGAGWVDVSLGSDMSYTRPQAQIGWRPTEKISLNIQGGIEDRKFKSGGAGDLKSPTYGASVRYQPVETTAFTFGASKTVSPSYFAGQITKGNGWTAGFEQRLLERFHLSVGLGHQTTSYISTASGATAGRDDGTNSFNARLSTTILHNLSIAALYQNSRNSSSSAGFTYTSNQVGIEVGWRF
jgi:hypothetical protein